MIPSEINYGIPISVDKIIIQLEYISAKISGEINIIFFIDGITQFNTAEANLLNTSRPK